MCVTILSALCIRVEACARAVEGGRSQAEPWSRSRVNRGTTHGEADTHRQYRDICRGEGISSHAADSRTAQEITDPEYPGVSEDRVRGYLYPRFTALRTWRYLWRHSRRWTYCLALRISSNSVLINRTVHAQAILSLSLARQASPPSPSSPCLARLTLVCQPQ
eukprot:1654425-Rhodomonas_salina.1